MSLLFTMLVPFLMLAVAVYGLCRKVDLWGALVQGAGDGLGVLLRIVPALIGLMTAVYMLRASGALELAGQALEPLAPGRGHSVGGHRPAAGASGQRLRRPGGGCGTHQHIWPGFSGGTDSGGHAGVHGDHLLHHCGLFRRGGVARTRYAVPAALCADAAGFLAAAWAVRLIFY